MEGAVEDAAVEEVEDAVGVAAGDAPRVPLSRIAAVMQVVARAPNVRVLRPDDGVVLVTSSSLGPHRARVRERRVTATRWNRLKGLLVS